MARLGWAEEVFYRRLMSVVDDFGRYWADHGLLRAACYPRQLNKVSDSDVGKWLTALVEAALVRVYPAQDGESYLELLDFRQQVRAKVSRFPSPASSPPSTCAADATQPQSTREASAPVFVDVDVDVKPPPPPRKRVGAADRFDEFWTAWPKNERKQDKAKCLQLWRQRTLDEIADAILADVRVKRGTEKWRDGFIEAPLVYLRGRRWEDGVEPGGGTEPPKIGAEVAAIKAHDAAVAAMTPEQHAAAAEALAKARRALKVVA